MNSQEKRYLHILSSAGTNSSLSTILVFFRFPSILTVLKKSVLERYCEKGLHEEKWCILGAGKEINLSASFFFPWKVDSKSISTGIFFPSKLWAGCVSLDLGYTDFSSFLFFF